MDSEDTDSIPELSATEPVRMAEETPRFPSPTDQVEDKMAKLRMEKKVLSKKVKELDKENNELDKLLEEVDKRGVIMDKELKSLPQDQEVDKLIEEKERIKQWLDDVAKARAKGVPIPDKPEGDIECPRHMEKKENTPAGNDQGGGPHHQEELTQESGQGAGTVLDMPEAPVGPDPQERSPVPIEVKVIIINKPPYPPGVPMTQENEVDLEDQDEQDSDWQIVEGPPEDAGPSRTKTPFSTLRTYGS